jgi:beta-glucuronidase
MRRLPATILSACLLLAGAAAAPAAAQDAPRERALYADGHDERFLLGGAWLHRLDPEDQGLVQGFASQESTEGWRSVEVPHAWNAGDDSPESQRGGVGWYRKDFRLPRARASRERWVIRFEAVNYRATVFLNGRRLGDHEGGYVPFEVDAAGASRAGVNRLVVRVDSRRSDTDLPPLRDSELTGLPGGGWWNYGGLLREVYLRRYDRVDVEELSVRPQLPCRSCGATVLVQAVLRNAPGGARSARLRFRLGSQTVESRPVRIGSNRRRAVSVRVRVANPRLWEPDSPRLYPARAEAVTGGTRLSSQSLKVGIRSVEVDGRGRLLVNGRPTILRGASIHEDHPVVGAALSSHSRRRMFAALRQLGANATRAHYPLHPEFVELADRHGVLVWDQIPFYRLREGLIALASVRRKGLDYLDAMVRRDRNHASVIAWSIANELPREIGPGQQRFVSDALRLLARIDPSRLTAIDIAGYPSVRLQRIYRRLDAIGINSYFGWYPGPVGSVLNREVLGPYLDQLDEYYSQQALVVTEFGAEANRDGPADEKGTYAFQSDLMRYHLSVYDSRPYLDGAIAWLLQDFKVRPGWDGYNRRPSPPYNKKGLLDEHGMPKPAFAEVRAAYRAALARQARRVGR